MTRADFKKLERGIRWDWRPHHNTQAGDGEWGISCVLCNKEFGAMLGKDYRSWATPDHDNTASDEAWLEHFRPLLEPHVFSPEHQANITLWMLAND